MIKMDVAGIKDDFKELKSVYQREYMLRRYQKLVRGQLPWEEQLMQNLTGLYVMFMTSWRLFIKRVLDVVVSSIGMVLAAPVMLVIAAVIKIDSRGPVIYKQQRVGQSGISFMIYKFRTMRCDAEIKSGPVWAKAGDERVTRVGRFLRETHLDELPQLFNVLGGEMSLVGPRPERPHFVRQLREIIPNYDQRHSAKPGVTGLAQIKRHYDETVSDVKKKVRYDVLYIKNVCPLLDVKVIAMTVGTVLLRTGR